MNAERMAHVLAVLQVHIAAVQACCRALGVSSADLDVAVNVAKAGHSIYKQQFKEYLEKPLGGDQELWKFPGTGNA